MMHRAYLALLLLAFCAADADTVNVLEMSKDLECGQIARRARLLRQINATSLLFEGRSIPDGWLKACEKYSLSAACGFDPDSPNLEEPCASIPIPDSYLRYGGPTNAWRYLSKEESKRGNALLYPDGEPAPLAEEFALRWSAVKVLPQDGVANGFTVYNNSAEVHLRDCNALCIYSENGVEKYRRSLGRLDIKPGQSGSLLIEVPKKVAVDEGARVRDWTFLFSLRRRTPWAEKGFVFARDQVAVFNDAVKRRLRSGKQLTVREETGGFAVDGDGFTFVIGKRSGCIESWRHGGAERLLAPIVPDFGTVKGGSALDEAWRKAMGSYVVRPGEMKFDELGDCVIVVPVRYFLPDAVDAELKYSISPEGVLEMGLAFKNVSRALLPPRAGFRIKMSPALSEIEWLGRGVHAGARAHYGKYRLAPDRMYSPVVEITEPEVRRQVRRAEFIFKGGDGFGVEGVNTFAMSVLPLPIEDLRNRAFPASIGRGGAWEVLFDREAEQDLLLRISIAALEQ